MVVVVWYGMVPPYHWQQQWVAEPGQAPNPTLHVKLECIMSGRKTIFHKIGATLSTELSATKDIFLASLFPRTYDGKDLVGHDTRRQSFSHPIFVSVKRSCRLVECG